MDSKSGVKSSLRQPRSILGLGRVAAGAAAYGFLLDALQKYHLGSYVLEMNVRIANWPGYFMLPFGFGLWSLISAHRFLAVLTGSPDLPISKYIEAKPETE